MALCQQALLLPLTSYNSLMTTDYANPGPSRADIDALQEPAVLEFGTPWCGHCQRARPLIEAALAEHPGIRHIKVEIGRAHV